MSSLASSLPRTRNMYALSTLLVMLVLVHNLAKMRSRFGASAVTMGWAACTKDARGSAETHPSIVCSIVACTRLQASARYQENTCWANFSQNRKGILAPLAYEKVNCSCLALLQSDGVSCLVLLWAPPPLQETVLRYQEHHLDEGEVLKPRCHCRGTTGTKERETWQEGIRVKALVTVTPTHE